MVAFVFMRTYLATLTNKFEESRLGDAAHILERQRDLDKLEHWALTNRITFIKSKCWILYLEWSNTEHKYSLEEEC